MRPLSQAQGGGLWWSPVRPPSQARGGGLWWSPMCPPSQSRGGGSGGPLYPSPPQPLSAKVVVPLALAPVPRADGEILRMKNALRASGARRWGGGGRGTESSGVSVVPRGPDKAGGRALSLGTPRESPALCRSGGMRARLAGAGLVPCPGPPEAVPYQWANQGRLGSAPVRPQGVGR